MKNLMEERSTLLRQLWDAQNKNGFIRKTDIHRLSKELGISSIEVNGVISFYHFLHRDPVGKNVIYLSNSMTSMLGGFVEAKKSFEEVKKAFEEECKVQFDTVPDPTGTFSLFETPSVGMSDQGTTALINFIPFTNLTADKVRMIIEHLRQAKDLKEIAILPKDQIRYRNDKGEAILLREYKMGETVKRLIKMRPDQVIAEMKKSGLSGRGGAFFPTGLKWEFAKQSISFQKYVICNADEGEPGTFKDRVLLNTLPGLLLEGMITGAYAIGATKGIIYLRAEYKYLLGKIERTIQEFYDFGLLGEDIMGTNFTFDIVVRQGAGSYVCGEETGLLESLEGNRGGPRTKVYFPVEKGYLQKPTIINNVETFSAAARIIELGSTFFSDKGTEKTKGTKLLSISGDCKRPGVYEIEWGMTIQEMLDLCEAKDIHIIQFSGPSGTVLSKEDFGRTISGEDLICGGSVMLFNAQRDFFDILTNFSEFFIHESCGLCTPCRAGNYLIGERLKKIRRNEATMEEIKEIHAWAQILKDSSRCGLGKNSTNFITGAINKFPELFEEKALKEKGFNLEYALNDYYESVKSN